MAADISRWIGTLLTGEMEEPSKVWEILLEVDIFSKAREEVGLGPGPDKGLRAGRATH